MPTTLDRILDTAQSLVQQRGYNGFSYADIAIEVGISKPSIHYHFPTKEALAEALLVRYRQRFDVARSAFEDESRGLRERLDGYAGLYAEVFSDGGRMCLCGVFAADSASLPAPVQNAVAEFFDDQRRWLATGFRAHGQSSERAFDSAEAVLAALEGALLLARASRPDPGSTEVVRRTAATVLDALL